MPNVTDVILGEARAGDYADMLAIASTIANRSAALGVTPEQVIGLQSEFNAQSPAPGTEKDRAMAEQAWSQVQTSGPTHGGMFYATPSAVSGLPIGLAQVAQTAGHAFFSDPLGRAINTTLGYVAPAPVATPAAFSSNVPMPTPAPRDPPPVTSDLPPVRSFEVTGTYDTLLGPDRPAHSSTKSTAFDTLPNTFNALNAARSAYESATGKGFPALNDVVPAESREATTGRKSTSEHYTGRAVDISLRGLTNNDKVALVASLTQAGFKGFGLGNSVLHADTRAVPATWNYGGIDEWAGIPFADWNQSLEAGTLPRAATDVVNTMNLGYPTPTPAPRGQTNNPVAYGRAGKDAAFNVPALATAAAPAIANSITDNMTPAMPDVPNVTALAGLPAAFSPFSGPNPFSVDSRPTEPFSGPARGTTAQVDLSSFANRGIAPNAPIDIISDIARMAVQYGMREPAAPPPMNITEPVTSSYRSPTPTARPSPVTGVPITGVVDYSQPEYAPDSVHFNPEMPSQAPYARETDPSYDLPMTMARDPAFAVPGRAASGIPATVEALAAALGGTGYGALSPIGASASATQGIGASASGQSSGVPAVDYSVGMNVLAPVEGRMDRSRDMAMFNQASRSSMQGLPSAISAPPVSARSAEDASMAALSAPYSSSGPPVSARSAEQASMNALAAMAPTGISSGRGATMGGPAISSAAARASGFDPIDVPIAGMVSRSPNVMTVAPPSAPAAPSRSAPVAPSAPSRSAPSAPSAPAVPGAPLGIDPRGFYSTDYGIDENGYGKNVYGDSPPTRGSIIGGMLESLVHGGLMNPIAAIAKGATLGGPAGGLIGGLASVGASVLGGGYSGPAAVSGRDAPIGMAFGGGLYSPSGRGMVNADASMTFGGPGGTGGKG